MRARREARKGVAEEVKEIRPSRHSFLKKRNIG